MYYLTVDGIMIHDNDGPYREVSMSPAQRRGFKDRIDHKAPNGGWTDYIDFVPNWMWNARYDPCRSAALAVEPTKKKQRQPTVLAPPEPDRAASRSADKQRQQTDSAPPEPDRAASRSADKRRQQTDSAPPEPDRAASRSADQRDRSTSSGSSSSSEASSNETDGQKAHDAVPQMPKEGSIIAKAEQAADSNVKAESATDSRCKEKTRIALRKRNRLSKNRERVR